MSDPLIPDRLHPVVAPALDLERVVPAAGGAAAPGLVCSACNKPVADEYFEIASKATCRSCKAAIEEALTGGSRVARVIRASLAGTVAAVAGAFLYHQLSKATDHEFAIAALVLGAMVGGAVRWGARRRGGWAYQWMAVLLTYASIGGAHLPEFIGGIEAAISEPSTSKDANAGAVNAGTATPGTADTATPPPPGAPAGVIAPPPIGLRTASRTAQPTPAPAPAAAAAPAPDPSTEAEADVPPWMKNHPFATLALIGVVGLVVAGAWPLFVLTTAPTTALLGLLITFFALQAAWKMNRKLVLDFTGPYRVATDPAAAPDPASFT